MKVAVERVNPSRVTMNVTVEAGDVERAWSEAYRRVAQRAKIPGFRPGKAPRHMIERHYGPEIIREEALDRLLPKSYAEALVETKLSPIDRPKVDVVKFEEHEPFEFKVEVEVKPDVELGKYTDLGVAKKVRPVAETEIDREIEGLRQRTAPLADAGADAVIGNTDFATIDFEGFVDGKPFEGGKAESQLVEVGAGQFIPGFEDGLVGLNASDEKEISVKFPDDYRAEDLAGKEAIFKVKVKDVKRRQLPEVNDEFAKGLGDYSDLSALRAAIRERLEAMATSQSRREYENSVVNQVVNASTVEPPEVMVEERVDELVSDMERRLRSMGLTLDGYIQSTEQTIEQLRGSFKESARQAVKRDLVLEAVARREGLTASEEDLDREIENMAKVYGQPVASLRGILEKNDRLDTLREAIVRGKAATLLTKDFDSAPVEIAEPDMPSADAAPEQDEPAPAEQAEAASTENKPKRAARKKAPAPE